MDRSRKRPHARWHEDIPVQREQQEQERQQTARYNEGEHKAREDRENLESRQHVAAIQKGES